MRRVEIKDFHFRKEGSKETILLRVYVEDSSTYQHVYCSLKYADDRWEISNYDFSHSIKENIENLTAIKTFIEKRKKMIEEIKDLINQLDMK